MSEEPDETDDGLHLEWYNIGLEMPTQFAAENCWQELHDKLGGEGQDISCWRLASIPQGTDANHPDAIHRIIVITGDQNKLRRIVSIAGRHGADPWEIPDDVLEAYTRRRLKVLMDAVAAGERKHINQRAHYGDKGAVVDQQGVPRPYEKEA